MLKRIFNRYNIRLFLNLAGSLLILESLLGSLWFDIVNFKVEVQGTPVEVRVRGGLFKVCYPDFEEADNGSLVLLDGEQCTSFTEVAGMNITRGFKLSNGCIVIGFFIGLAMLFTQLRKSVRDHPLIAECYLIGFGLNMAAASIALGVVTSSGILVCNCLDEFGRDGWINVAGTNLILICFFISNTNVQNMKFRHKGIWFIYEFFAFFAVMLIVFTGPSWIHDTTRFDSSPSEHYLHNFNQTTTTTTTTTTTSPTMSTRSTLRPTSTTVRPTLPSISLPTLPNRKLERCQKR